MNYSTHAMILAALMVWVITMLIWYLNRSGRRICAICVGVSGTWLALSAGIILGFFSPDYKLPVAMLMGGTVVGIAFQGEKALRQVKDKIFYWKSAIVIIGMPLAYFLFVHMNLLILVAEAIILIGIAYLFSLAGDQKSGYSKDTAELDKKMKDCC